MVGPRISSFLAVSGSNFIGVLLQQAYCALSALAATTCRISLCHYNSKSLVLIYFLLAVSALLFARFMIAQVKKLHNSHHWVSFKVPQAKLCLEWTFLVFFRLLSTPTKCFWGWGRPLRTAWYALWKLWLEWEIPWNCRLPVGRREWLPLSQGHLRIQLDEF